MEGSADMARMLSAMGYDLIVVARSRDKLEALKQELNTEVQVLPWICPESRPVSTYIIKSRIKISTF